MANASAPVAGGCGATYLPWNTVPWHASPWHTSPWHAGSRPLTAVSQRRQRLPFRERSWLVRSQGASRETRCREGRRGMSNGEPGRASPLVCRWRSEICRSRLHETPLLWVNSFYFSGLLLALVISGKIRTTGCHGVPKRLLCRFSESCAAPTAALGAEQALGLLRGRYRRTGRLPSRVSAGLHAPGERPGGTWSSHGDLEPKLDQVPG